MHVPAIIEHFPYLGLFALLLLGGLGLPFPEDATLIVCGFLIATDVVKPVPAILVVYAGILVTDWGLYAVGKKYGRLVVSHRRFRTILSAKRLSSLEEAFRKRGVIFILIGRHLTGLSVNDATHGKRRLWLIFRPTNCDSKGKETDRTTAGPA